MKNPFREGGMDILGTTHYNRITGADPELFLGGGALVSCSTSTPINHIVFFLAEYQLY